MPERERFGEFFRRMVELDAGNVIHDTISEEYPDSIMGLLDNQYVFSPFWDSYNGRLSFHAWNTLFRQRNRDAGVALATGKTVEVLTVLFDRLYVLRNQLLHGGATWGGSVNRKQVEDGAEIMAFLVPRFISLMMDNPNIDWGAPSYPVVRQA